MFQTMSEAARELPVTLVSAASRDPRWICARRLVERHSRAPFLAFGAVVLAFMLIAGMWGVRAGALQGTPEMTSTIRDRGSEGGPAPFGGHFAPYGIHQATPIRILYIGASVTRGWYVTSLQDSYPAIASRTLEQARDRTVDWQVVAQPGATAGVVRTWRFPKDQDIVVVHSVTNDFLFGTPPARFARDYLALLQELRKDSPRAALVCLGEWEQIGDVNRAHTLGYVYDRVVNEACAEFHGVYVPLTQDFVAPGTHGPRGHPSIAGPAHDTFHPNDYGDQLIAESVVAGIEGDPPIEEPPPGAP